MKVCGGCGETYSHHVDFCFRDGELLVASADASESPGPSGMASRSASGAGAVRVDSQPAEVLSLSRDLPIRPLRMYEPEPPELPEAGFGPSAAVLAFLLLVPLVGASLFVGSVLAGERASEVAAPTAEP